MPKVTSAGPSNQHEGPQHEERTGVNEEGNPTSVLEQEPIDAGEPEPQDDTAEPTESTQSPEQGQGATGVQDEVPEPPEVPQEPEESPQDKAARLQAELDALKNKEN